MADITRATLTFTEKLLAGGRSEIEFRVFYVASFSADELGRTFTESFNLIERDVTSDNDVVARNLSRQSFVADAPSLSRQMLPAKLSEEDVDGELGNEEIFAVVRLVAPLGLSGDVIRTNEVEVPV